MALSTKQRTLFDATGTLIIILTARHQIEAITPAITERLGYTPPDLRNRPFTTLLHPDDYPLLAQLAHSERPSTLRLRHKDGRWFTFSLTGAGYLDEKRLALGLVPASDVATLQQQVETLTQLRQQERRQRELAETLREVTAVLNTHLDRRGVLTIILEQLGRVTPYDSAAIMLLQGNGRLQIVARNSQHPNTLPVRSLHVADLPHVQQLIEEKTPLIITNTAADHRWLDTPEGAYIRCWMGVPLLVQDEVIGLLNLNRQRHGAYQQEDANVALTFANQAAIAIQNASLYQQAQQEIEVRKKAEAERAKLMADLQRSNQALAAERASLAERVAERTAQLSAANAKLSRAARLKDEFLANMSHELRTPLHAILGKSEMMEEGMYGSVTEEQQRAIEVIQESGQHLLSLINDILDVAKVEAGKLELEKRSVSVREVATASLRLVKQAAQRKNIQLSSSFTPESSAIWADGRRLKQILVNLLSNAVKFTPEGGDVGLNVVGDAEAQEMRFEVWDTGVGIAVENLDRLFQPFVQLDASLDRDGHGTGLGLSLVYRLSERHGGSVRVESEKGEGSRFIVTLPWTPRGEGAEGESEAPADPTGPLPPTPPVAPHILLVEDNEATLRMIRDYLALRSYRMTVARNGQEAVDRAREDTPDLIIMDIQMPEMDGLEAMRRIRADQLLPQMPILALTALAMPGDKERCLAAGADQYLQKPVSMKRLLKVLDAHLEPEAEA